MNWIERTNSLQRHPDCPYGLVHAFKNDTYEVQWYEVFMRRVIHLMIRRHDDQPIRSWKDMQDIKNSLVGGDRIGIEVFPADSELIDRNNIYHLWVLPKNNGIPFYCNNFNLVNWIKVQKQNGRDIRKGQEVVRDFLKN